MASGGDIPRDIEVQAKDIASVPPVDQPTTTARVGSSIELVLVCVSFNDGSVFRSQVYALLMSTSGPSRMVVSGHSL